MGRTRQPNTPYLVFFFVFTLTIATRTTGSVNCQTGSLLFPFGYPIRFNCSKKTGDAEIGEFAVQEVTNANIYVEIPPVCEREIHKIQQLFGENFAPSSSNNVILAQGCNQSLSTCFLSSKSVRNLSKCKSPADVMSIGDVVNPSGCKYWSYSILTNTKSQVSLENGRLQLDWWLKDRCSNTTCSANANCTDVKLAGGGFGHRCTCLEGFRGNAFTMYGGCRSDAGSFKNAKGGLSRTTKIGIGLACGFLGSVATGLLMFMVFSLCLRKRKTPHHPRYQNLKELIQLKQYSYAEVKKITKSFSHAVGKGGFGTVYRGKLCDGCKVAVKILKDFKGNGEDFINEVASMSQTSHVNIVSLLGFCYEGSKRAIIYDFLENGSLDQFFSKRNSLNLDVSTIYGIALGVARGLEYLHHGCKTRIVHFDIKPQNILLDDNLCPKVSDFGLAKLCEKRESILSLLEARGTIGYIAPEVFSGMYGRVSHKSDVYSYGMLVLEMIGARNKETVETAAYNSSSTYFPDWIYKDLENGEHTWKVGDEITREEKEIAKKMTLVGLWCIQPCPSNRPPMNRVVEMMEGSLDALEVPPKPSLHLSAAPLAESSSLSGENSSHSEVLICSTS